MARVDSRDVLDRLADLVEASDFEIAHPGEPVARCECGATLVLPADGHGFVCAGCGELPTYKIRPFAGDTASCDARQWERGVPPETSAELTPARKDANAPDGSNRLSGSGVLGRAGNALRSLRLLIGAVR